MSFFKKLPESNLNLTAASLTFRKLIKVFGGSVQPSLDISFLLHTLGGMLCEDFFRAAKVDGSRTTTQLVTIFVIYFYVLSDI